MSNGPTEVDGDTVAAGWGVSYCEHETFAALCAKTCGVDCFAARRLQELGSLAPSALPLL